MSKYQEYYKKMKAQIACEAMEYQSSFARGTTYYWSDLARMDHYFNQKAIRFGLVKEFKENGIL